MQINNQENVNVLLQNDEFKPIRDSEEFYFQKGQDKLNEWLNFDLSPTTLSELSSLSKDYKNFKTVCEQSEKLKPIADLLYTIISYCDTKAYNKEIFNQYPDKRSIARAGVYMNAWIKHLLLFKSENQSEEGSTFNGFLYLMNPLTEINVLSENHRKQISKNILKKNYERETFVNDIVSFFDKFNLALKNDSNRTHLIARILYTYKSDWFDEVIGLMAADSTGWQDSFIKDSKSMSGLVLWNHRTPTGKQSTIKALRTLINDGIGFNFYYSSQSKVKYKAEIIDFATNQEELNQWDIKDEEEIYNYHRDFAQYTDGNKTASIVLLARRLEKITPIDLSDFSFYKSSAPRQVNVSPIKREPEEIITIDMDDIYTTGNKTTPDDSTMNTYPLNQILFGPPGTGKTYHTINKALEILGYDFNGKSRKEIKEEFEKRVKSGQIVFTTFHQSLSYEDFIEGLKPIAPKKEGNPITYKVVDGIFKQMCVNALPFGIGDDINGYIVESVTSELLTLKKKQTDSLLPMSLRMLYALNRYLQEKGFSTEKVKEKISFSEEDKARYPEIEPYLVNGYNTLIPHLLDKLNETKKDNNVKVLIIDEINRGNVSQIFGELITLIEQDKRIGESEELSVILPYSKQSFGIPNNLHIIGTMNTADRSVEALDSALRRRFVFEEMKPDPDKIAEIRKHKELSEKIEGIDLGMLLKTINSRIEKLLDRDHAIGHSYFLDCRNIDNLKNTFYKNIIPLLQEYFYGDYAKIGLVLGAGFVNVREDKDVVFADFGHENIDMFNEKKLYQIIDYRINENQTVKVGNKSSSISFDQAIGLLLGIEISVSNEDQE